MKDDRLHWLQHFLCCCCTGGRYESIETLSLTYWLAVHVDWRVYNFRVFAAPVTNHLSEPRASSLRYCNGFVLTRTIYGYDLPSDFTPAKSNPNGNKCMLFYFALVRLCTNSLMSGRGSVMCMQTLLFFVPIHGWGATFIEIRKDRVNIFLFTGSISCKPIRWKFVYVREIRYLGKYWGLLGIICVDWSWW